MNDQNEDPATATASAGAIESVSVYPNYLKLVLRPTFVCGKHCERCVEAISKVANNYQAHRLLVECFDEKRISSFIDAYYIGVETSKRLGGKKLALLFHGQPKGETEEFVSLVAQNRGAYVEHFADEDVAVSWLLDMAAQA